MSYLQNRLPTRARIGAACALAGLAIASTVGAASAQGAGTPTFPAPASERVRSVATTPAPQPITTLKSTSTAPARTHARSKSSGKLSTAAIVVAAVAALMALGCAAWGLARRRAFEPHWLLSLRHAMAEAGFRTSATWAEFADWARLGR